MSQPGGYTAPFFRQQFFGPTGKPLSGGRIEFYSAGSAVPKSVYAHKDLSGSLGNVLVFDGAGHPVQYFMSPDGEYDIKIYDQFNQLIDNPLRIDGSGSGTASPYPDPTNPGFLRWDGSTYSWVPITLYPDPNNTGYLKYDLGTQTYSWAAIPAYVDDHKVALDATDTAGYLTEKISADGSKGLGWLVDNGSYKLSSANWVAVSGADTVPASLRSKLVDTSSLTWTIGNPGGGEYLSASVNFAGWADAYKVKTIGSDSAGYLKDKIASSSQITKLTDIDGVISFELADGLRPTGLAGGDLTGSYPDPLVKELSGLGTSFSPVPAVMAGTSTPLQFGGAGGRGIAFKVVRGYGLAIDSIGQLYSTQDGGLTWRKAAYFVYSTDLGADIAYGKYDGTNYGWVFVEGRDQVIKYLPDIPANYDANGVPLSSAWVTVTNATSISWGDITWNDAAGYWLAAGNSTNILRRASLTTGDWANVKTLSAVAGGVAVTNTGRTVTFERDTGVVWYSDTISAATPTWTKVTNGGFTPTITNILDYASMTTTCVWGSAVYGDGMVAFADYNAGLIVTTTDVADYSKYQLSVKANSLPGIYDITYDGANWYATNGSTTAPAVYQLFIGSIPSHRPFVAEKGEKVLGQLTLPELPNAQFVGTDAWGNIVAKSAPVVGGGYTSTMYIANAVHTLAPNLISRSELIVLLVPIVDTNVIANTSKFGTFLSQGGTGNMRYTLRDEQYRLIGYSAQITNPTPVFTELTCTNLFDPVTQSALTSYNLLAGGRYYLGVLWDANGIQIIGDDALQTVNTNPLPAFKIDNLASMTPLAVLGSGSESKMRPFLRIKGS